MFAALTSALPGLPLPGLPLRGLPMAGLALPGLVPSGLLVLAAITLTGLLIAVLAHSGRVAAAVTAIPQGRRAAALREKSWRARPGPGHPRRPRRPPDHSLPEPHLSLA